MDKIKKTYQYNALKKRYGIKEQDMNRFFRIVRRAEKRLWRDSFMCITEANYVRMPDSERERIMERITSLFVNQRKFCSEFIINDDCRGAALKLDFRSPNKESIAIDFGGYGIIAPDGMVD